MHQERSERRSSVTPYRVPSPPEVEEAPEVIVPPWTSVEKWALAGMLCNLIAASCLILGLLLTKKTTGRILGDSALAVNQLVLALVPYSTLRDERRKRLGVGSRNHDNKQTRED